MGRRRRRCDVDPEAFQRTLEAVAARFHARPPSPQPPPRPPGPICWGGWRRVPDEQYHSIPPGWSVEEILIASSALGGTFDLRPVQIPASYHAWLQYRRVMENIAAGVVAHDPASVELAVRYIELHFIGSYSGYLRQGLARRLKHVVLLEEQRVRLSRHFANLLRLGERCYEFTEYLRLWRGRISESEFTELEALLRGVPETNQAFAQHVLAKLRPNPAVQPTVPPSAGLPSQAPPARRG
jgi:hypothetical protein